MKVSGCYWPEIMTNRDVIEMANRRALVWKWTHDLYFAARELTDNQWILSVLKEWLFYQTDVYNALNKWAEACVNYNNHLVALPEPTGAL